MCLYPRERKVICRDGKTRILATRCGRCFECQKAYSTEWALRLYHEKKYHLYTLFLTLTYDDAHLSSNQLVKKDIQDFILELKKYVDFRYFLCGEYGGKSLRPHFHVMIFTDNIDAFELFTSYVDKYTLSPLVARLWKNGFHSIETNVEFATMRYVAKYMQKSKLDELPKGFQKPFLLMSHKPYIGMREKELCDWYFHRNGDLKFYIEGFAYNVPNFYNQVIERNGFVLDKRYNERRMSNTKAAIKANIAHQDKVLRDLMRPYISI